MGYFTHLYLVEVVAEASGVRVSTSVFGAEAGIAYFCWGAGTRPAGLHAYGGGTGLSDTELTLLPGYPLQETHADPDRCLIEAAFTPMHEDDPVLVHFVLPDRFVPRRTLDPLVQPVRPFVCTAGEKILATYPVKGRADIRFWILRLQPAESLGDFDLTKLLHPDEERAKRVELEFNLGIFKVKLA